MKVSLNWLKRYVDIDVPAEVLCDKMTMSGFEVEEMEDLSKTMDNVVAARSSRWSITRRRQALGLPGGRWRGRAGADHHRRQNVAVGSYVPCALHDSHLPNGAHIKRASSAASPPTG